MKTCKSCGILLSDTYKVKHRLYCKWCWSREQKEQFNYWYDSKGKPKKKEYEHICNICGSKFISQHPRAKSCSDECRRKYRNIKRRKRCQENFQ